VLAFCSACACAAGSTTQLPPSTSVADGDTGDDDGDDGETGSGQCVPGQQNPCLCEDGSSGVQTCQPGGGSYGACMCFGGDTGTSTTGASDVESSGSSSSGSEGNAPDPCVEQPDDDECTLCTRASCCDELSECWTDPACACMVDCIDASDNPDVLGAASECAGTDFCDTDLGQVLAPLQSIQSCQMANCEICSA
jgi:hypothetical protein